jgi:hypothetical protein
MKCNGKTRNTISFAVTGIMLGIMLLTGSTPLYAATQTPDTTPVQPATQTRAIAPATVTRHGDHRNNPRTSRNDIYQTIRELQQKTKQPVVTPIVPVPQTPVVAKPPVATPKPQTIAPKKGLMYQAMGKIIPHDPYVDSGFSPIATDALYGVSGLVALAGALLVVGKPAFIAQKLASLFTFA